MLATIELSGRAVAYLEVGDGPATPLLCVHGFTGCKDDFGTVVDVLAADRRVVAVDLPGHGSSAGSDDPAAYELTRVARWLLAVVDALGLGRFHLLGHSLGGLVAQRVAVTASQRVSAVVLNATGPGAVRGEVADRFVRMAVAVRDEGLEAAYRISLDGAEEDDTSRARFLSLEPAAVVGGARSLTGATPVRAAGVELPVLVVHGSEDDVWSPREQRLLAATFQGARRVEIAGGGHAVHADRPGAWLQAVRPFLRAADGG